MAKQDKKSSTKKQNGRRAPSRHTDYLRITRGALGPVPACELAVKPLTVFIGPQGTGKSLMAQVLYFFEELPYLVKYASALLADPEERASKRDSKALARTVLDRLRSSNRAFATFANPKATITYQRSAPYSKHYALVNPFAFTAHQANRRISPNKNLVQLVDQVLAHKGRVLRRAVFFPTERMVITLLRSAMAKDLLSLPLTYSLFSDWMELATRALAEPAADQDAAAAARWIAARGVEALGGSAYRHGEQWKWRMGSSGNTATQQFDIDLASSGQRANWSIPYLAQAFFMMDPIEKISRSTTLFVEEPEIHLHPAAQVAITQVLSFLVRHGYRVVITTHSLAVIYALNNLVQASRLRGEPARLAPAPEIRLPPDDVSVYAFRQGKKPRDLVERATGFIDETELGHVSDELSAELNGIDIALAQRS